MSKINVTYHNLLDKILQEGYTYEDPNRKGVNRLEIPSYTFRHEFKDGFPAISTKKLHYKNVVTELIWFLRGDTNIKYLVDNGCNIWNKDAYNYYLKQCEKLNIQPLSINNFIIDVKENKHLRPRDINYKLGDLGPVYGKQWTDRNGINQIKDLIENLKNKPLEARHYVDVWNPEEKHLMALPPCHYGFQIVVRLLDRNAKNEIVKLNYNKFLNKNKSNISEVLGKLNKSIPQYGFELHWNQMSCDTFLGIPYNIASYATLALILEKITGYKALAIQGDLKKVHLYDNSLDAVKEQLSRDVDKYDKCELKMDTLTEVQLQKDINLINDIEPESFKLQNYKSYPAINVKMLERDK
jgi:thymidylate synthase